MKEVNNYMEILVEKYLESVLAEWDICKCDKCKKDITALALNSLPPMYTTTEAGCVYVKVNTSFNPQYAADVVLAIDKAIQIVSEEVRHGESVYLIGFMGSGKSTIGQELAMKLKYKWVDLDKYIEEHQKMTIKELFESCGEPCFRKLEMNCLKELEHKDNLVVSTGGGVIMTPENVRLLKKQKTFYLKWDFDTLFERVSHDENRPLVKNYKQLWTLYHSRTKLYEETCCMVIEGKGKSTTQISEEIISLMEEENENSCD